MDELEKYKKALEIACNAIESNHEGGILYDGEYYIYKEDLIDVCLKMASS